MSKNHKNIWGKNLSQNESTGINQKKKKKTKVAKKSHTQKKFLFKFQNSKNSFF